jgi:hypothetical protein
MLSNEGHVQFSRIVLFGILCLMMFTAGCIMGPQAPQQGTWSRDDHFSHKTTPEAKEAVEKPAGTAR